MTRERKLEIGLGLLMIIVIWLVSSLAARAEEIQPTICVRAIGGEDVSMPAMRNLMVRRGLKATTCDQPHDAVLWYNATAMSAPSVFTYYWVTAAPIAGGVAGTVVTDRPTINVGIWVASLRSKDGNRVLWRTSCRTLDCVAKRLRKAVKAAPIQAFQ